MTREELLACLLSMQEESQQRIAELEQQKSELAQQKDELAQQKDELARQLEWFKRQLFGEKSERRLPAAPSEQLSLGEMLEDEAPPPHAETVKQYERRRRSKEALEGTPEDSGLRFDETVVPVKEIPVPNPEIEGLSEDDYEVIGEKDDLSFSAAPARTLC